MSRCDIRGNFQKKKKKKSVESDFAQFGQFDQFRRRGTFSPRERRIRYFSGNSFFRWRNGTINFRGGETQTERRSGGKKSGSKGHGEINCSALNLAVVFRGGAKPRISARFEREREREREGESERSRKCRQRAWPGRDEGERYRTDRIPEKHLATLERAARYSGCGS